MKVPFQQIEQKVQKALGGFIKIHMLSIYICDYTIGR